MKKSLLMLRSIAKNTLILSLMLSLASPLALALKSDQEQPATLDADEFDWDFQTGVRTYRGNVVYRQGTIRLTADEIVAYFKDGKLERAIARGNPARFKQRPDGKPEDMTGVALRIELDEIKQLITLTNKAVVTQGNNTISGRKMTYNMVTEKVTVKSGGKQKTDTAAPAKTTSKAGKGKKKGSKLKVEKSEGSTRPRLIISPRKKKSN